MLLEKLQEAKIPLDGISLWRFEPSRNQDYEVSEIKRKILLGDRIVVQTTQPHGEVLKLFEQHEQSAIKFVPKGMSIIKHLSQLTHG